MPLDDLDFLVILCSAPPFDELVSSVALEGLGLMYVAQATWPRHCGTMAFGVISQWQMVALVRKAPLRAG